MSFKNFQNIVKATKTGCGYSEILDVTDEHMQYGDFQESYWLAETLKYAYLIHAVNITECHVGNTATQKYVFTTEGHPLRVTGNWGMPKPAAESPFKVLDPE